MRLRSSVLALALAAPLSRCAPGTPPAGSSLNARIVCGQGCAGLLKRRTGDRFFEAAFPVCGKASGSPRSNR